MTPYVAIPLVRSASRLIPELKQGGMLWRPGITSHHDTLSVDEESCVVYLRYFGEGEWSEPEYFTLEEIATWTDDGGWEVHPET